MNRFLLVFPVLVWCSAAGAQGFSQPPNRPSYGIGTVTMNPTEDGFYNAVVMVSPQNFSGDVNVPWLQVTAPHVKTPEEAKAHIREKLQDFASNAKAAADQVNQPMR